MKKTLHRSIEKKKIIECKAHTKKMQPSERVICPDIECLIIHSLWGRLSQTVCVNRFHFWMLGFLLVLFCLWILIPTVRFLMTKCQIRSEEARQKSQAFNRDVMELFYWPYVQDLCERSSHPAFSSVMHACDVCNRACACLLWWDSAFFWHVLLLSEK